MVICPNCKRSARQLQMIVQDPKNKKKKWLITFCGTCKFNFDLEESIGGTTPQEEIDKPGRFPAWDPSQGKFI